MLKKLRNLTPVALASLPLLAEDTTPNTLPDIGFNISDYLTVAVQGLGSPIKIVLGAAIVLSIAWAAYRWFKRGSRG